MKASQERVIFLVKEMTFGHRHMVLDMAEINALPKVKYDLEMMTQNATVLKIGRTTIHYLQRLTLNDKEALLPWSESFQNWHEFLEWGTENLCSDARDEYLKLHPDEILYTTRREYNLFSGPFDAAWKLKRQLEAEDRSVSFIIVIDEKEFILPSEMCAH